jgi:hypothetical protein
MMPVVEVSMLVKNKKTTRRLHGMWAMVFFIHTIDVWAAPIAANANNNDDGKSNKVQLLETENDSTKDIEKQKAERPMLPTIADLMRAKFDSLTQQQDELMRYLGQINIDAAKALTLDKGFDEKAYFSLSMVNNAPFKDYRLDFSKIYLDGILIAQGGKRNWGLPPSEQLFFGNLKPGCHEITVEAKYTRLTNTLIDRFKINRVQRIKKTQAFIAKNGYEISIKIEGFEKQNTFFDWYKGPDIRFDTAKKPNFLPGEPLVSMDAVLNQGRVKIIYTTEDISEHRLLEKSLSIDGLPILQKEHHIEGKDGSIVFGAPLREGKHRLNAVLLFGEKKWISGGMNYNFRLSFDRDFYVAQGFTTLINLVGMPKGGISRNQSNTKYAQATTQIIREDSDFFPGETCKEIKTKESKNNEAKIEPLEPSSMPKSPKEIEEVVPSNNEQESNKEKLKENVPSEEDIKTEDKKEDNNIKILPQNQPTSNGPEKEEKK